jgi:hypothetical protein
MFSKKRLPVVALALLVSAAAIVGASQIIAHQVPAGPVITAPNAAGDKGLPTVPSAPALPAPEGTVAFSDDFSSLDAWTSLADAPGKWVSADGRLENWGNAEGEISNDPTVFRTRETSFAEGTYEAMVYPTSGEGVGLVFGGSDAGYYKLTLYPNIPNSSPKAYLHKVTASGNQELGVNTTWAGVTLSQWQRAEVNVGGGRIIIFVDGIQLFDVAAQDYSAGWVGVWSVADRGVVFDNARVQRAAAGR